jgi:hypothetical protein
MGRPRKLKAVVLLYRNILKIDKDGNLGKYWHVALRHGRDSFDMVLQKRYKTEADAKTACADIQASISEWEALGYV